MKLPVLSTLCLAVSASVILAQEPAQNPPAVPGGAPTGTGTSATDKANALSSSDKAFLKKVLEGMFFEMSLTDKGKRDMAKVEDTKKAMEKINTDLNKVWGELAGPYSDAKEKPPTELSGGDKSKAQRISKAGDRFDKEVLETLGRESKGLARDFESGSKSQNPVIKQVTTNWLPTIKGHADEVEKAAKVASKAK